MAAVSQVVSSDDLLFHICLHATPETLWNISLTSKVVASVAQRALSVIVKGTIQPFVDDVHDFFRMLKSSEAVISGDIPLDIATANQPVRPLAASILRILVPCQGAEHMRAVFMEQNYGRLPVAARCKIENEEHSAGDNVLDFNRVPQGCRTITRLIQLAGTGALRVDILESQTIDAAYPALFETHSADCNIITADYLCVVCPRLTNGLQFDLKRDGLAGAARKVEMEMRKFKCVDIPEGKGSRKGRRLFDKRCMVLSIHEVEPLDRAVWSLRAAGMFIDMYDGVDYLDDFDWEEDIL